MAERADPEATPRIDEHPGQGAVRGTQRMEIFADAVFAIAFTLPVLELKVPEPGPGFGQALLDLWPFYFAYLLSALIIGLYWVHHHFSGAIYRTTGHHFLLATVLFLASVGFIAFPARALAERIVEPEARGAAAIFYVCGLAVVAATWLFKWKTGCLTGDVDDRLDPSYVKRLSRKYELTTALSVVAVGLVFVNWVAGLTLAMATILFLLRAPETPAYTGAAPEAEGQS
ncbi:MAG TPA: TMEM175 family protein [Allosphingosinicella sp.]|jgi:uncharacterized membrane protein